EAREPVAIFHRLALAPDDARHVRFRGRRREEVQSRSRIADLVFNANRGLTMYRPGDIEFQVFTVVAERYGCTTVVVAGERDLLDLELNGIERKRIDWPER